MKFNRLRLSGFKTFVDPTELLIEPGLTGVVGPNGCGKSNLLEALRWVMGETSFKSLRGSVMDDVIFSGSSGRPARNTAEVTLTLDNSSRLAPAQFNNEDTIEVSRRIEREAGSAYRINAREARARDVQMLFADAATGAHSVALVRQGQIGEIISAKPKIRRVILEEAAGISGLHHRRHEAELRLRAAEQNLQRIDDVIGGIDVQLVALQRQARQAARYKGISVKIREAESLLLHLRWKEATSNAHQAEQERKKAAEEAAGITVRTGAAAKSEIDAAEKISPRRKGEAEAAAALQRLRNKDRALIADAERSDERRKELLTRIDHTAADIARENKILADQAKQIEVLSQEEINIKQSLKDNTKAQKISVEKVEITRETVGIKDESLSEHIKTLIELRNSHKNAAIRLADCKNRSERLKRDALRIDQELAASCDLIAEDASSKEAEVAEAQRKLTTLEGKAAEAAERLETTRSNEHSAREKAVDAERTLSRLEAEAAALGPIAGANDDQTGTIVSQVSVMPGYETAFSAALGDDIDASTAPDTTMRWRALDPLTHSPELPEGADPLNQFVTGPDALNRRLTFTGVVTAGEGDLLQRRLMPGQRLVTRDGDLWRWDGFIARAGAKTSASKRLAAGNRLNILAIEIDAARDVHTSLRTAYEVVHQGSVKAETNDRKYRETWRLAGQKLDHSRAELANYERKASEQRAKSTALQQEKERISSETEEARTALDVAETIQINLEPIDATEAQILPLRDDLEQERTLLSTAEADVHAISRMNLTAEQSLKRIFHDYQRWQAMAGSARIQISKLTDRRKDIETEAEELREIPADIAAQREKLANTIMNAEKTLRISADRLSSSESELGKLRAQLRFLEASMAEARETLARTEEREEAAQERLTSAVQIIRDDLNCAPEEVLLKARLDDQKLAQPNAAAIEEQLYKSRAERERLGPVNLRAEEESYEQQERSSELRSERDDLDKAIRRLRHGIGTLNAEARGRLVNAFDSVNKHFGELFKTLFGGGSASLKMTESDDPLEAGLEVIAHPPGKRPQTLTLLSGGEQALTAFALILAVFRTNPSPICVLDEVDAPLDDHNVERFCNLVTKLAKETGTRFLVITHHPYTMARMDRLFGVTMAEPGVSKLVSVDLDTAESIHEA